MRIPFFGRKRKKEREQMPRQVAVVHYSPGKKKDKKVHEAVVMRRKNSRSLGSKLRNLRNSFNPSAPNVDIDISLGRVLLLLPILTVLLTVGFIIYLHQNQVFLISNVEIFGNEEISDLQIFSSIGDLRGQSMFQVAGADIESVLLDEFPYIKDVYVDKKLPGEISITVIERFPEFAYMNLSGAYLVDSDYVVVEILGVDEVEEFTEREILILEGLGDPEADYVLAEYISKIEDEEVLGNLDWAEVPFAEKQQTLDQIRAEIQERLNVLVQEKIEFVNRAGFANLQQAVGYDAKVYSIGDEFSEDVYAYTFSVAHFLEEEGLQLKSVTWKTDFTIVAELSAGMKVLFTSIKPLEPQFEALQTLRASENLNGVKLIDLRSEIIAVQ